MRRSSKIFRAGGAVFSIGALFVLLFMQKNGKFVHQNSGKVRKNHLPSELLNQMLPDEAHLDPDNEKWLKEEIHDSVPGVLVCSRKRKAIGQLVEVGHYHDHEEISEGNVIDPRLLRQKTRKSIPMSQLSPTRPMGCCPPGDPLGKVYKIGSACCVNQVFNVSTHFCCTVNSRLLKLTNEDIEYCHPKNGLSYCRIEDLEMERKKSMKYVCQYDERGKPTSCEFSCPEGSRVADGMTTAKCSSTGVFDNIPFCCQGCKENFRLDLIFLLQSHRNQSEEAKQKIRAALKDYLSYLKIGRNNVRVGFAETSGASSQISKIWNLKTHGDLKDAFNTVDNLHLQGGQAKIGANLQNLATDGFRRSAGDRKIADNLVITILQEPSLDQIFEGSKKLKQVSKVIAIGVGNAISDSELSVIASSRENIYKVPNIRNLKRLAERLHEDICGSDCI